MADQVNRTVGTQSYSGASGPSKPEGVTTVYDGDTPTSYNPSTDPVLKSINPPEAQLGSFGKEKVHYPPCINPSCKSYGHSHPNCRCYAGPGGTSLESATFADGGEVGHHCSGNNMHKAECEHYEHPQETIDGAVAHHGLLHLLTKTGKTKSQDPMRAMHDHKDASIKGRKTHHSHVENLFSKSSVGAPRKVEALKDHFEKLQLDPESLLEIGRDLDPQHSAQIAAFTGTAMDYFSSLKPVQVRNAPLDEMMPMDKMEEAKYNRQLEIAENPHMIVENIKDGTLRPSDIKTVSTLYPRLYESMVSKANDTLITAIAEDKEIPYKQKQSLSLLLGIPLDTTQTPQAMQAIINCQVVQQANNQAKKEPKKPSSVEMKQINKTNDLYENPIETSLINQKQS